MRRVVFTLVLVSACHKPAPPEHRGERGEALFGPCGISVTKVNYDRVGVDDGTLEAVELRVSSFHAGATLGDCGLTKVAAWEGDTCVEEPSSRAIDTTNLVIPEDGFVVLARGGANGVTPTPDATTPSKTGVWLENGPDWVALHGRDGVGLAIVIPGAGGKLPACSLPGSPPFLVLPEDPDVSGTSEHVLALCGDSYVALPTSSAPYRQANPCPDAGVVPDAGGDSGHPDAGSKDGDAAHIPCGVVFSKLDVRQPKRDGALDDTREAVELLVRGDVPEGATLATCGVATLSPYNANTDAASCGAAAGFYAELAIGDLVVPTARRLIVGNRGDANRAWAGPGGVTSSILQNGPDYLTLRGPGGAVVTSVAYPSAAGVYPSCGGVGPAANVPGDPDAAENYVVVLCSSRDWQARPERAIGWKLSTDCSEAVPALDESVPPLDASVADSGPDVATDPDASAPPPPAPTTSTPGSEGGCALSSRPARASWLFVWVWLLPLLRRGRAVRSSCAALARFFV